MLGPPEEKRSLTSIERSWSGGIRRGCFLPRPVPRGVVDEALALAQHAPSNSNIQPWRLVFASGTARDRLNDALFRVVDHEAPDISALPKAFEHYRYQLGAEVYGSIRAGTQIVLMTILAARQDRSRQ